ncbi:hypothetical protein FRC01_002630, partial [Tulasnella sp. 417]
MTPRGSLAVIDNSQPLEFTGKDSKECERFISAVLKHAFAQGMQRDDAWIADFVATCLAEDALRWWLGLDEVTQGSWKLLRRAMALKYQPLFSGASGEEAEKFVQMVYQRARDAGKQGDNRWIMEFVPTCLEGDALRWYASLDRSTRTEWDSFQQAIFSRYPNDDGLNPDLSASSIVPTPAAALPISRPPRQRGRIRLTIDLNPAQYYVSKRIAEAGLFLVTSSLGDALEVEHDGGPEPLRELYISENQVQGFDVVGIVWCDATQDNDPTNFAAVGPINSQTNKWAGKSTLLRGPVLTKVWRMTPAPSGSNDSSLSVVSQNVRLYGSSTEIVGFVLLHPTPPEQKNIS